MSEKMLVAHGTPPGSTAEKVSEGDQRDWDAITARARELHAKQAPG